MARTKRSEDRSGFGGSRLRFFIFIVLAASLASAVIYGEEETISLATWNIRKLSDNSRTQAELILVAAVVSRYDFIAVQEVHDQDVLERLTEILKTYFGRDYAFIYSDSVGRDDYFERYAFLYNEEKVFWKDTAFLVDDPDDHFVREPFCADFQAGNFDFYALNFHAVWGDSVERRQAEAEMLAVVFWQIHNKDEENDLLLMGDFNLPPADPVFNELKSILGVYPVNNKVPTKFSGKLYDNIWLQLQFCTEFTGNWGVDHFDKILFDDDGDAASLAVSDHRPVWIEVEISGPDDD